MPELGPEQQFEVDASLVDPDGLVARATGATNGSKRTSGPGIAAVAAWLPERVVGNEELAGPLGVDSNWISSRTGIHRRRRVGAEGLVDLAAGAGAKALALAGVEPGDLDLVLVATFTHDQLLPNAAPQVAGRLGAGSAGAIDIGAACTGFLSALSLATAQLESGRARAALVVGAEVISNVTDFTDRRTAGLFGDGAGAAVLVPGGPGQIGPIALRSDGSRAELIHADHDDRLVRMDGRATFRAAVAAMSDTTQQVVSDAGLALDEIDLFVYHQANSRIISAVGERLDLPRDRVIDCLAEYGNTSAASIPIALSEAASDGAASERLAGAALRLRRRPDLGRRDHRVGGGSVTTVETKTASETRTWLLQTARLRPGHRRLPRDRRRHGARPRRGWLGGRDQLQPRPRGRRGRRLLDRGGRRHRPGDRRRRRRRRGRRRDARPGSPTSSDPFWCSSTTPAPPRTTSRCDSATRTGPGCSTST